MLTKPLAAPHDDSYLVRFCQVVVRRLAPTMSTAEGRVIPGVPLQIASSPLPCSFHPLFRFYSRKESMYLIEKAAAATAASVPRNGQFCLHCRPTTNFSGRQGFRNIFSNNFSVFNDHTTTNNIPSV